MYKYFFFQRAGTLGLQVQANRHGNSKLGRFGDYTRLRIEDANTWRY